MLGFKCRGHVHYLPKLHDKYSITNESKKQDVYNVFIVMQCLLSKNQYALLHNTLLKKTKNLNNKLKTIDTNIILSCLGFPNNWYLTANCHNLSVKNPETIQKSHNQQHCNKKIPYSNRQLK